MARLCLLVLVALLALAPSARAQEDVALGTGLDAPTAMALAPDGRIFVTEQGGNVRVIEGGELLDDEFLSVPVTSTNERGLLGIAFDPAFATNRFLYVYYTRSPATANRLSRFRASASDPNVVEPGSETVILDGIPSEEGWHNGGAIHFGPDGKLYVAVGENHSGENAQDMEHLGGKLLRINADGSIPTDNPFYGSATGVFRSIWALGLRNPFTFDIQPSTGRIFINDVGQNAWEEIDEAWVGPNTGANAGFNFGWPDTEGPFDQDDFPAYRQPFYAYPQTTSNGNCALTGGAFYNPATVNFPPQYVGDYFFTDFCNGWVDAIDLTTKNVTRFLPIDRSRDPVDIKVGPDGSPTTCRARTATRGACTACASRRPTSRRASSTTPTTSRCRWASRPPSRSRRAGRRR
jgi:glucose/arabinose dehydrogenase